MIFCVLLVRTLLVRFECLSLEKSRLSFGQKVGYYSASPGVVRSGLGQLEIFSEKIWDNRGNEFLIL